MFSAYLKPISQQYNELRMFCLPLTANTYDFSALESLPAQDLRGRAPIPVCTGHSKAFLYLGRQPGTANAVWRAQEECSVYEPKLFAI